MKTMDIKDCLGQISVLGRTLYRPQEGSLYFNWTCSGVELYFRGRCLIAELCAMPGMEKERDAVTGQMKERETWPWAAVVLDDRQQPARTFEVACGQSSQLLFCSDTEETHRIRLVKQTENGKGYLGLQGFRMDGSLCPLPAGENRKRIQLIGDSITCGFGNGTTDPDRGFYPADENGWMSHGVIAARLLGMEPCIVSSSGICVTEYAGWDHAYAMDTLYPYTDRMLEDRLGAAQYTRWDFTQQKPDYVVLNLGTNDANALVFSGEEDGCGHYRRAYRAFLEQLRKWHGLDCWLICALGSMDYYLYPEIQAVVESYRRETGDTRVAVFRYPRIYFQDPLGACRHPHIVTHQKMAAALAAFIKSLPQNGSCQK